MLLLLLLSHNHDLLKLWVVHSLLGHYALSINATLIDIVNPHKLLKANTVILLDLEMLI